MSCSLRHAIYGLFWFVAVATPLTAHAQQNPPVNSEALALFNSARALMAQGKYAEACPMLEKAKSLHSGIGLTFNLADCHEQIGRTASAWTGFQDTAAAADIAGQPDRARVARQRADALLPRLSKLRIVVSAEVAAIEDFDVRRDEVSISRLLWGKDVPVDPGRHSISATAPKREPWSTTARVVEPGKVVTVDIPMLKISGVSNAGVTAGEAEGSAGGWVTRRTAFLLAGISGGIAALGLGVGIGFSVSANEKSSTADSLRSRFDTDSACYKPTASNAKTCDDLYQALKDQGLYTEVAIGSLTASGVFAIGAGAMFFMASTLTNTNSSGNSTETQIRMVPVVNSTQKGIFFMGAW